jgi:hypothetical protein
MFRRVEHPGVGTFLTAATPLAFDRGERVAPGIAPQLGQHTAQVLASVLASVGAPALTMATPSPRRHRTGPPGTTGDHPAPQRRSNRRAITPPHKPWIKSVACKANQVDLRDPRGQHRLDIPNSHYSDQEFHKRGIKSETEANQGKSSHFHSNPKRECMNIHPY